jgi:hypothetical protein
MTPVFFVLAIMGCGDDQSDCAQVRVEPTHYATAAACTAALPAALARNTDVDYPVVSGACRSDGMLMAEARSPRRG